jgi:hypothetical protein
MPVVALAVATGFQLAFEVSCESIAEYTERQSALWSTLEDHQWNGILPDEELQSLS